MCYVWLCWKGVTYVHILLKTFSFILFVLELLGDPGVLVVDGSDHEVEAGCQGHQPGHGVQRTVVHKRARVHHTYKKTVSYINIAKSYLFCLGKPQKKISSLNGHAIKDLPPPPLT